MDESEVSTPMEESTETRVIVRPRKKNLYKQIRQQMEFYLSDVNLSHDKFLQDLLKTSKKLPLGVFLTFNKMRTLTESMEEIAIALRNSQLLKVSKDGTSVYRTTSIQQKPDINSCVIYVEQLPPDANCEWVSNIFSAYGKVDYVQIPKYKNKTTIKGFAFVEFDTPETAKKALEAFESAGCCLSSQPHELRSIVTYNEENPNNQNYLQTNIDSHTDENNTNKKRKCQDDFGEDSSTQTNLSQFLEEKDKEPESKKKKINADNILDKENKFGKSRIKILNEDGDSHLCDPDESESSKPKKRKLENENVEHEICSESEVKGGEGDNNYSEIKTKKKSVQQKTDTLPGTTHMVGQTTEDESQGEGDPGKSGKKNRARKRNKRKREKCLEKKESDPTSLGLRIISKTEWTRLRSKYLNLQRNKMQALKSHLNHIKYNKSYQSPYEMKQSKHEKAEPHPKKAPLKYIPGVILHIELPEPLGDVISFKADAKSVPGVHYVDANYGESEVHIRCNTANDAEKIASEKMWDTVKVLSGEAEKAYWNKIFFTREQMNNRPRMRGKDKLLKKAERELGKHIKFDDTS